METTKLDPPTISSVTNHIVFKLDQMLEYSSGKKALADLRNSIGKPLSQSVSIWPFLFENFPPEFLSKNQNENKKERAILNTLQLYALYRQGVKQPIPASSDKTYVRNIGSSLSALRTGDNILAMDRRFNALITSATYEEFIYHLRQMMKLLKSKTSGKTEINFGKLANDLFEFLINNDDNIRLNWARAYYRTNPKGETTNE